MIFRSEADKSDLAKSWHRPNRSFFASGACHILAHVFLQQNPDEGYHPVYILPAPGFRGSHVVASNGSTVFDFHGYSDHAFFMDRYFSRMRRLFPGWQAELIQIETSLVEADFCSRFNHRRPDHFFQNPLPRALSYLTCFSRPEKCSGIIQQPHRPQSDNFIYK